MANSATTKHRRGTGTSQCAQAAPAAPANQVLRFDYLILSPRNVGYGVLRR